MNWEISFSFSPVSCAERDESDLILSIFCMTIRHKDFGIYGVGFLVISKLQLCSVAAPPQLLVTQTKDLREAVRAVSCVGT